MSKISWVRHAFSTEKLSKIAPKIVEKSPKIIRKMLEIVCKIGLKTEVNGIVFSPKKSENKLVFIEKLSKN